ncbi:unnamed protein product [Cuscuta epithymum]|uniref:P-type ATPase C-terminal domain-containing protein n=1 Tax=Cuscuta epithymum TaxID=186058 RepID=A0AAV0CMX5_9ASTE|nr:unnamed protein product [Cuscuta epithymum]
MQGCDFSTDEAVLLNYSIPEMLIVLSTEVEDHMEDKYIDDLLCFTTWNGCQTTFSKGNLCYSLISQLFWFVYSILNFYWEVSANQFVLPDTLILLASIWVTFFYTTLLIKKPLYVKPLFEFS